MRSFSLFPELDSFFVFSDPFFHHGNRRGLSNLSNNNNGMTEQVFSPATDLSETDKEIKVICNVPGMKKDKLKIDIDEEHHTLTLSGTIEKEKKEENEKFHAVERSFGSFSRTIKLPRNANLENVKANLEDGVLRVSVTKIADQPKKIRSVNIE